MNDEQLTERFIGSQPGDDFDGCPCVTRQEFGLKLLQ
jgi:hypothetical protein